MEVRKVEQEIPSFLAEEAGEKRISASSPHSKMTISEAETKDLRHSVSVSMA